MDPVTLAIVARRYGVSVRQFGAKGDGVADDTAAIQAAVNASNIVYFPAGIYRVTSQITISGKSPVVLCGGGPATVIRSEVASPTRCIYIDISQTLGGGVHIADMTIENVSGVRSAAGLAVYDTTGSATDLVTVRNVTIRGFAVGLRLSGLAGSTEGPSVTACHFYENNWGLHIVGSHDVAISGCVFASNLLCDIVAESDSPNLVITGNSFDGSNAGGTTTQAAIWLKGAARSTISGNVVEDYVSAYSILLEPASSDVEVSGNYLFVGQSPSKGGIKATGNVDGLTIAGNHFNGVGTCGWAIDIPGGSRINIIGNTIVPAQSVYDTTKLKGILLANVTGFQVSNNLFDKIAGTPIRISNSKAGRVSGNVMTTPCADGSSGPAILLADSTYLVVSENVADIATTGLLTAVVEETGTSDYNTIALNRGRNASSPVIVIGANSLSVSNA